MKKQADKTQTNLMIGFLLSGAVITGVLAFIVFNPSGGSAPLGAEYSYEIEKYAKIDPALIAYEQVADLIKLDFKQTRAMAVGADDKLYVVGDEKMAIYVPPISVPMEIELNAEPTCIHVDADGTMFVGIANQVIVMDSMGVETARWSLPETDSILTSIATDKENVFVADAVNKVVWRYDRKGQVTGMIGQKDEDRNIPGFVIPSPYFDVAMASDGLLRVVNPGRHWIEAYTVDGHREWYWGTASVGVKGFSGCCNPVNFAILPDGGFVTAEKGLVRVKTYDAEGEFESVVAGPDQLGWIEPVRVCNTPDECQTKGFDVAVDSQGRIYVLDTVRNVIRIFTKKETAA
ncbi:MAG: NHL repeat-containing protein [Planctomycetota bacterium]|jgi:hypothetical protein